MEQRKGGRDKKTLKESFKIAAGFSSAEIRAALYGFCSAVADLRSEVFFRHMSSLCPALVMRRRRSQRAFSKHAGRTREECVCCLNVMRLQSCELSKGGDNRNRVLRVEGCIGCSDMREGGWASAAEEYFTPPLEGQREGRFLRFWAQADKRGLTA